MKSVIVILSDGFEEIEAISTIDILRRGLCQVEVLGLDNLMVTGAHGITIECDEVFEYYNALSYDGVVLVGGMANANNLAENQDVLKLLEYYNLENKMIAGICATPSIVFSKTNIVSGLEVTCYPDKELIANLKNSK